MKCLKATECRRQALHFGVDISLEGREVKFLRTAHGLIGAPHSPETIRRPSRILYAHLAYDRALHEQLATLFLKLLSPAEEWLLWLRDWGIWGMDLYDLWEKVRQSLGDQRPMIEAP